MTTGSPPATPDFIAGLRKGETAASHFTIIANAALRDPHLSWGAKGLFANLMSHAENFVITEEFLCRQSTDGVKTVRRLLGELRERGYVYRGARMRYPKGTVNAAGKDISGALGPYQWFVTDKPDEIAVILARYAEEQRAIHSQDTPGQNQVPNGKVVPTSENDAPVDNSALGAERAGSADQGKQEITAGGDNRPEPTGGFGTSLEDDHQKTTREDQAGGAPPPDPRRTPDPSGPGNERETSPKQRGTQSGHQQGDHKKRVIQVDVHDYRQISDELAKLLAVGNPKLTQAAAAQRATRTVLEALTKPALDATGQPTREGAMRHQIREVFSSAAADAGVDLEVAWAAVSDAA